MPDLKQQIAILYDMEMNILLMTRLIDKLNSEISLLGISKQFREPDYKKIIKEPEYKKRDNYMNIIPKFAFGFGIVFAIIMDIINISLLPPTSSTVDYSVNFIFGFFLFGIIGIVIGGFFGLIIREFLSSKNIKETNEHNNQLKKEYNQKIEYARKKYNEMMTAENIRIQKELRLKKILTETKDALVHRKNEAYQRLQNLYAMTNIAPSFRYIIPMGYMNLFISLNITTKLEGENGLYDRVLKELRYDQFQGSLDEICRKLDRISSQLDDMNNNQRNIYQQLVNLNYKSDTMIDQTMKFAEISVQNNQLLENVVKNTDIAKYNSERIRKELEYQNMMEYGRRYYN